ncbi:MAG: hypothetical protein AB1847_01945, partial [bacterium]
AEWNAPVHDTLTITFDSDTSFSTIAVGDFITLGKDAVLDQAGNPLTGSVLLEGSFNPVADWYSPAKVYTFSVGRDAANSIDNDPNTTCWTLFGYREAEVTFQLAADPDAHYGVSRIQVIGGDTGGGRSRVDAWIHNNPDDKTVLPTVTWEVDNTFTSDSHISPEFDFIAGGYLTIKAVKITPGPLGRFFCDVKFFGIAPPSPP